MVTRVVAWLVYPGIMGMSLGALYYLVWVRQVAPEWALFATSATATALVIALERVIPYLPDWNRSHGDFTSDAIHGLVNLIFLPAALQALAFAALSRASLGIEARLGRSLWPDHWPVFAQLGLALLVAEFGQYWLHRLMHSRPWLWRLHAIHHGAPRLYWLNAARVHPLDALFTLVVGLLLLVLLGVSDQTLALYLGATGVHATLQHSNLGMRLGWGNWLLSQAELHRFHHAPDRAVSDHNYGTVLIVWDVVFGTRYLPKRQAPPTHPGIDGASEIPRTYLAQLIAPFRAGLRERSDSSE